MSPGEDRRRRVAILGGGAAGIAAAFELTASAELRERFEVTVHLRGWRLGGKGASGREAAMGGRILEHGLHVWFGFYRNSLTLLERAFEELRADQQGSRSRVPWRRVEDAFLDCEQLVLNEPSGSGWRARCVELPSKPPPSEELIAFWGPRYLLDWLLPPLRRLGSESLETLAAEATSASQQVSDAIEEARMLAAELEASGPAPGAEGLPFDRLGDAMVAIARVLRKVETGARRAAKLDRRRRSDWLFAAQQADLAKALLALVGRRVVAAYAAGSRAPFDHLNGLDLRAALAGLPDRRDPDLSHDLAELRAAGLSISPDTSEASFVRVLYDLAFAYRRGDPERPDVAAGVAIENLINIGLRHRGRLMRKMRSGMGDVVFAPLYEALRARRTADGRRCVHFEFFSSVRGIDGSDGLVERISLERQALLRTGSDEYVPYASDAVPEWPSEPRVDDLDELSRRRLEQLAGRAQPGDQPAMALEREDDPLELDRREELLRGRDFDSIVLAIPVGALGEVARPLVERPGPLREMVAAAEPVMTQALQLWLEREFSGPDGLGWPCRGSSQERISGAHAKPFDTCADMSHLLAAEHWPAAYRPAAIAYLCGVLDERSVTGGWRPADRLAATRARSFIEREFGSPSAPFWQTLRPEDLFDPRGRSGWDRFAAQYWRANTTGWERYSTSHSGTIGARLRPDGTAADGSGAAEWTNLALAGDWTYTAINAGSFEAAVSSGIEAAAALIRRFGGGIAPPRADLPPWRRR